MVPLTLLATAASCSAQETGDCAAEVCPWPARMSGPGSRRFAAILTLQGSGSSYWFVSAVGGPITEGPDGCSGASGPGVEAQVQLAAAHSVVTEAGGFELRSDTSPSSEPGPFTTFTFDPGQRFGPDFAARAVTLDLSPGGWLRATLDLVPFAPSVGLAESDAGTAEAVVVEIEGPVGVDCAPGTLERELPTREGSARVRCGHPDPPTPTCNDQGR